MKPVRRKRSKMKRATIALLLGITGILLLVQVSGASYAFDGVPYPDKLDLVAHGTFKCGIYVGESYELAKPPCTRTFALPDELTAILNRVGFSRVTEHKLTNGIAMIHLAVKG